MKVLINNHHYQIVCPDYEEKVDKFGIALQL